MDRCVGSVENRSESVASLKPGDTRISSFKCTDGNSKGKTINSPCRGEGHVPDVCLGGDWAPLCVMPQPKECNLNILAKLCDDRPKCVRWNRLQLKWKDGGLVTISQEGTGLSPELLEQANELKRIRTDKLCRSACFRTGNVADCWMEHPNENPNTILEFVDKVFAPEP